MQKYNRTYKKTRDHPLTAKALRQQRILRERFWIIKDGKRKGGFISPDKRFRDHPLTAKAFSQEKGFCVK